jgi:L-threonylcarbamoyladenylate synthase
MPVVLPTDTVYGLAVVADRSEPSELMYRIKGRDRLKPTAIVAADVETLLELMPELRGRSAEIVRELLPGPYTLILPNPARRYRWITGATPDAIGVRVPDLPEASRDVVAAVGAVAATSANEAGGADPRRLDDVPASILDQVGAVVDGGELPGTPSTVLDFTGDEPRVVREGAVPSSEVFARLRL